MRVSCTLTAAASLLTATMTMAADQVFTMDDGSEITLREDQTWECKGPRCADAIKENFPLDLSDGRTVVIEVDNEWHTMAKGELIGTKDIKIDMAAATTSGMSSRVDAAEIQATKAFWPKIANKLIAGAPKRKLTNAKVRACMDELRLLPDITRTRDAKSGAWTVTASIKLDRKQILAIVKCSAQLMEEPVAAKDSASLEK